MKLVDATVAVDHLRGTPAATELLLDLTAAGEMLVASDMTRSELLGGVRRDELDDLEVFFSSVA